MTKNNYSSEQFEDHSLESHYKMVGIGHKAVTERNAIAKGVIDIGEKAMQLLQIDGCLPKGDPLILAEIAGINGAKKAYEMIPLCHPLSLEQVLIKTKCNYKENTIEIFCFVATTSKTGVEMEALSGVNAALLAIYDLAKNVDPNLSILGVRLLLKEGGKSKYWRHPMAQDADIQQFISAPRILPLKNITSSILTLSNRAAKGEYIDKSGRWLNDFLVQLGSEVISYDVIHDDEDKLTKWINDILTKKKPQVVITTGGTGLSPNDITTKVMRNLFEQVIPGIGELIRAHGRQYTKHACLSDSIAGIINDTLIICLPGNPRAVQESMEVLTDIIPHSLHVIAEEQFID